MALDIQAPLDQSDKLVLDGVLLQHLRLEPPPQQNERDLSNKATKLDKRNSIQQPPLKFGTQNSRPTVNKSTIESENKRRPGVSKRNSEKYQPPPADIPDPNSDEILQPHDSLSQSRVELRANLKNEAKTVTIHRMQGHLQEWNTQLRDILEKKAKNELEKRSKDIRELSEKYSLEHKIRIKTEKHKEKLSDKLSTAEEKVLENEEQIKQLESDLAQYQLAYQEMEARLTEWEKDAAFTSEQLDQSESMRRRLNDQVTELQGQLAIEEQRSKICIIL